MKKIFAMFLAVIMAFALIGCGENTSYLGPKKTADNTISATLTGDTYPGSVQLHWARNQRLTAVKADKVMISGINHISFIITGDEKMDDIGEDRQLSAIQLNFTGLSSGKTATLENSLLSKLSTGFTADKNFFEMEGNTFTFDSRYFDVGEMVLCTAVFTYTRDKLDSQTAEGYFQFTVVDGNNGSNAPTGNGGTTPTTPTSNGGNNGNTAPTGNGGTTPTAPTSNGGNNGNTAPTGNGSTTPTDPTGNGSTGWFSSGCFFTDIRYRVNSGHTDHLIERYEEDALNNVIHLSGTELHLTVYTRESAYDIVKAYIDLPDGTEAVWSNDWFEDNCHKFVIDLSQYSGKTITLNIRLLAGPEWMPLDFMYGFIAVEVP